MIRKELCVFLSVLLLLMPLCASGESRVYAASDTDPFGENTPVLTVQVAPLHGADCMLITLGEHTMMVDSGTSQDVPQIREMLREAGVDHVDIFFNSHPHSDHVGGFITLAEEGFPFGELITVFPEEYSGNFTQQEAALQIAREHQIPVTRVKTGDTIPFSDAEITVYRMPDDRITDRTSVNDQSAMLMIRYGGCSILLTGDVELPAQAVLAEVYDLKADICKYPHHGLGIMDESFLKEIDPEYVFIPSGSIRSLFGQQMLRENGYHRVSIATWGVITMQTDGTKWIVSQSLDPDLSGYIIWFLNINEWIQPVVRPESRPFRLFSF